MWARLALAGNPTVLLVLFVPDGDVVHRDPVGAELVANAHRFVSRRAAERFLGYLRAQRAGMTGESSVRTNRPELVALHGYDTKYAMHALRLGIQGVELLSTGRITLPVPQPHRDYLRAVRRGEVPWFRGWVATRADLAPSTRALYGQLLERWIDADAPVAGGARLRTVRLGAQSLASVTPAAVREWDAAVLAEAGRRAADRWHRAASRWCVDPLNPPSFSGRTSTTSTSRRAHARRLRPKPVSNRSGTERGPEGSTETIRRSGPAGQDDAARRCSTGRRVSFPGRSLLSPILEHSKGPSE